MLFGKKKTKSKLPLRGYKLKRSHLLLLAALGAAVGVGVYLYVKATISYEISGAAESFIVSETNSYRLNKGRPGLRRSGCLTKIARNWSVNMANKADVSQNTNLRGQVTNICGAGWSLVKENVGVGVSAESIWEAFKATPTTSSNLTVSATHTGVGVVVTGSEVYVTQIIVNCIGECAKDADWNSAVNDPPDPTGTEPVADLDACARTVQFKAKATDSSQVQLAVEYWQKGPKDVDFVKRGWAPWPPDGGVYSAKVNSGVVAATRTINAPLNDNLKGIEYKWRVKAKDTSDLESGPSGYYYFKILPDTEKPTVPGAFNSANVTKSSVNLIWDASTDNCGVSKYVLTRTKLFPPPLLTADPSTEIVKDILGSATSYLDSNLESGSYYQYELRAEDIYGNIGEKATHRVLIPLI